MATYPLYQSKGRLSFGSNVKPWSTLGLYSDDGRLRKISKLGAAVEYAVQEASRAWTVGRPAEGGTVREIVRLDECCLCTEVVGFKETLELLLGLDGDNTISKFIYCLGFTVFKRPWCKSCQSYSALDQTAC